MVSKYKQFLKHGKVHELKFYDDDVIKFKDQVEFPDVFDDGSEEGFKLQAMPNTKYTIRKHNKESLKEWVIVSGNFKNLKTGEINKRSVSLSPYDLKDISKSVIV